MLSLKTVMRLNASSCLLFGAVFSLWPNVIAGFLGGDTPAPSIVATILGLILIGNGLHLLWAARPPQPKQWLIIYFSIGDFLWVLLSIGLILTEYWVVTREGIIAAGIVGLFVGLFGIMQLVLYKITEV